MPRDNVGRRIRSSAAGGGQKRRRRARTPRELLLIKLGAGGLALLAVVLAIVAAQAK